MSQGLLRAGLVGALAGAVMAWTQAWILPFPLLAVALGGPMALGAGAFAYVVVAWLSYVDTPRPASADRFGCGMDCIGFYEWPPEGAVYVSAWAAVGLAVWLVRSERAARTAA
jgi:hypothetical protein